MSMDFFTNMLLKSFKIRASLAIPQIKMMQDRTSNICSMSKVIFATLKFPRMLNTQQIKGSAKLSRQTKTLAVLSLQLCMSSGSLLDLVRLGKKVPGSWTQKASEPGWMLRSWQTQIPVVSGGQDFDVLDRPLKVYYRNYKIVGFEL